MSIFGCGSSTTELPATAGVRVEIDIEQRTERTAEALNDVEYSAIKAVLRTDKGTAIEQEAVQVLLNGEPLRFLVGQGNYYDRHPYYKASDEQLARLEDDTDYHFEVTWPDGTRHPVGVIRTPPRLSISSFDFPRVHRLGSPLSFSWNGLESPASAVVYRGFVYPDGAGNEVQMVGSPEQGGAISRTIGPGLLRRRSGTLRIPDAFFAEQPGDDHTGHRPMRVASVYVDVKAETTAPVSGVFHKASYLRAVRLVKFYIEVTRERTRR